MIENEGKVSEWDARFFHIYSKGRIKELDVLDIRKGYNKDVKAIHPRLIVQFLGNYISFRHGEHVVGMPLNKLEEIINAIHNPKEIRGAP